MRPQRQVLEDESDLPPVGSEQVAVRTGDLDAVQPDLTGLRHVEAGLVDRFRVVVFPVITGSTGRERIYDGYPDVGLEMVASRKFDGRLQLLEYVPTVLTGPPSSDHPAT